MVTAAVTVAMEAVTVAMEAVTVPRTLNSPRLDLLCASTLHAAQHW